MVGTAQIALKAHHGMAKIISSHSMKQATANLPAHLAATAHKVSSLSHDTIPSFEE